MKKNENGFLKDCSITNEAKTSNSIENKVGTIMLVIFSMTEFSLKTNDNVSKIIVKLLNQNTPFSLFFILDRRISLSLIALSNFVIFNPL